MTSNDNVEHPTKRATAEILAAAKGGGAATAVAGDYLVIKTEDDGDVWQLFRAAVVRDGLVTYVFDAAGRERKVLDLGRDRMLISCGEQDRPRLEALLHQPFVGLVAIREALRAAILVGRVVSFAPFAGRPAPALVSQGNAVIERMAIAMCRQDGRAWTQARRPMRDRYRILARTGLKAARPEEPCFDDDIAAAVAAAGVGVDGVIAIEVVEAWIDEVLK